MDPFEAFRRESPERQESLAVRGVRHVGALLDWFGLRRVLTVVAAAVAVGVGGWWLLRAPAPAVEQRLPYAGATTVVGARSSTSSVPLAVGDAGGGVPTSLPSGPAVLVVHVAGAVRRPGLVRVPTGSRVLDAVTAAGGPAGDADVDSINLAAFVVDAGRVYVPREGEAVAAPDAGAGAGSAGPALRIDLNAATAADLDRLPGIGPSLAAAVVAYRTSNGPFRTVDALLKVPGIGPSKLEQFRALVRV